MIDILQLAESNDNYFTTQPLERIERACSAASLLAAFGVTPSKRAVQHGHLHQLFAGMLVLIHDDHDCQFILGSRDTSQLAKQPLSSGLVNWLDTAVEQGLLLQDGQCYRFTTTLKHACRHLTDAELINA